MNDHPTVTVIGAGHGGKAMAAYLATQGWSVQLYNRTPTHIEGVRLRGGIELEREDGSRQFGPLRLVTSDIGAALQGAQLVLVVVPSSAHRDVAVSCAPYLRDGQVVVLNPGRTGGALEFRHTLQRAGCQAACIVAEASTFIFASRSNGPADVKIFRIKNAIPVAAMPATDTAAALAVLRRAFPEFVAAETVLHTSLDNMGAIFHPALTILNAGRIESTRGNYQFYVEGLTPSIARVLETLDRERVTVAAAVGVRTASAKEWLQMAYNATGSTLYDAMLNDPGYYGITAPANLEHRYIFEDVPMSLVPIAELGRAFGVATPGIDTIVHLASIIHGINYRSRGRTLERLGLAGMTLDELRRYVATGEAINTPGSEAPAPAAPLLATPAAPGPVVTPIAEGVPLTPLFPNGTDGGIGGNGTNGAESAAAALAAITQPFVVPEPEDYHAA
jgi:opine dehydrogenase